MPFDFKQQNQQQSSYSPWLLGVGGDSSYGPMLAREEANYNALRGAVLPQYQSMYDQARQDVQNYGQTALMNTRNAYSQQMAQQQQGLVSRGLGNTTVQNSVQSGLAQRRAQDLGIVLPEQISQYQTGVIGQFGGALAGATQQLGLANMNAQQQLGMHYLSLLGAQNVGTKQQSELGLKGIQTQMSPGMPDYSFSGQPGWAQLGNTGAFNYQASLPTLNQLGNQLQSSGFLPHGFGGGGSAYGTGALGGLGTGALGGYAGGGTWGR